MHRSTLVSVLLVVVLAAALALSAVQPATASRPAARQHPNLATLSDKVQSQGTLPVIVQLDTPFQMAGSLDSAASAAQDAALIQAQDDLLARLPGVDARSVKKFTIIPGLAVQVDAAGLAALAADPAVIHIEEDVFDTASLAQSVPLIGAPAMWAAGYSGAGQTVAILDTGVDKNHPFLAGKVVSEACFSTNNSSVTSLCPGGATSSTAANSALPYATGCYATQCDHGTHVAGIAAGKDPGGLGYNGVAKDATIIAFQVFSKGSSSVGSYASDQILAMQRVLALKSSFAIASINLSLGGSPYATVLACEAANVERKAAIDNLRSAGIATIISSGNDGSSTGISAPACISSAISVGSSGDGSASPTSGVIAPVDAISTFSNSASFLTLLAPGEWITSSIPAGAYATWRGTSMAAPHVTGAWAVMRSKFPGASVDQILNALVSSGKPIADSRNGVIKPRIQLDQAANGPFSISGKVTTNGTLALAGVTLSTGGVSTTSAADGSYTLSGLIAANYTVTPFKTGLAFNPASIPLNLAASQANINFQTTNPTFTISGNITLGGAAGQNVLVSDGAGHSVTSDASGNYQFSGLLAGNYTLTPAKAEYNFNPATRPVTVGPNAGGINFAGTLKTYSIAGKVTSDGSAAIAGVVIGDGAGHTATTAADGTYTIAGLIAGTYTLTPSLTGFNFSPASVPVKVGPSQTQVNFLQSYPISGKVTTDGVSGVAGVMISDGLGHIAVSAADGSYTLFLPAGSYTLLPLKIGYALTPFKLSVLVPNAPVPNQNFSAALGGHFTFLPQVDQ